MKNTPQPELNKKKSDFTCAHCGDKCENKSISLEEKYFCCFGCKTVYEILHENGLEAYYNIDFNPGISLKKSKPNHYFDFLENDDIKKRILDFDSASLSKVHFYIPSIHCSSCIWLLENLHNLTNGIENSRVNFPKKEISIDFDPQELSLRALVELLSTLGYEPEINLEKLEKSDDLRAKQNKQLLTKLGVAGFAFGNIMLFSFPEYLGLEELFDLDFKRFFGYINLLFALPIIFYCATDYFTSAWSGLKKKFISIDVPISLGILALFIRSSYEVISSTGAGYFDSLAGLLFFLLLGKWFQNRTYESLLFDRNYKSYFPIAITRVGKENKTENVSIDELEEGDNIIIRNNELIPADSILKSDYALIDNSFVTGESELIRFNRGEYIYAGGKQSGSKIELEVQKPVSQSYLTQLWNREAFEKPDKISTHILVNRISKYFTVIILMIAFLTGAFWLFIDSAIALNAFTAVLIVACPCALALSTPFTTGNAMRVFGRNGFYVKNGDIIEKLAEVDKVVFDKTGTVTHQEGTEVLFKGELTDEEQELVQTVAINSTHPLSKKISANLNGKVNEEIVIEDYYEVSGEGIRAFANNKEILLGSHKFAGNGSLNDSKGNNSQIFVSVDKKNKGFFSVRQSYRSGFSKVIDKLKNKYNISVLSGDNDNDKTFLEEILPKNSEIRFRQSPYSKLEAISDWQSGGNKIAMFGDGLNDAGALAQSNVGVAVTDEIGSFTPASDVIMSGKSFSRIPDFLKFSKLSKRVIIYSFIISFLYNVTGLSFAVAGELEPLFAAILMPLSSITVVVFASVMVNLFAKKLNLEL